MGTPTLKQRLDAEIKTRMKNFIGPIQPAPKPNPKHTLYRTPEGFVMNASQLNQANQMGTIGTVDPYVQPLSRGQAVGQFVDKFSNRAVGIGQGLLRGGASIGATLISPLLNRGEMVNEFPTNVGVLSDLIGSEPLKTIPGLFQEGKTSLASNPSGYGPFKSTLIAGAASLAPLLDLSGFEGEAALNTALKGTRSASEAATILRKVGVAEDLVGDYAKVFAKAKTIKEVQKGMEALEGVLRTTKQGNQVFQGFTDLSTNTLEKLKGRTQVSKQFISDLTNSADMKQAERDVIRNALQDERDVVDVPKFANKVKTELLPLKRKSSATLGGPITDLKDPAYESTTLPVEVRGNVANYTEHVYESPIKTSAGDIHPGLPESEGYFAHTRVEDMANSKDIFNSIGSKSEYAGVRRAEGKISAGDTRRVIELQSDLFQKGRLEAEKDAIGINEGIAKQIPDYPINKNRASELAKLEPYRNTWHERVIREEVKQAAIDGKSKLQFPTGETAMKIEGLGYQNHGWIDASQGRRSLEPEMLKQGKMIEGDRGKLWIITDVLGDGKFKAISKDQIDFIEKQKGKSWQQINDEAGKTFLRTATEQFDISGKVDTNNPIYRFYEKEVGRYLTNKYGAKQITDSNGVKWWQVNINPSMAQGPIRAFAGVPAGFETDEQGNIKFNPAKATLGALVVGLTHDESLVKSLANLSDEGKVANLLRKAGLAEELITKIASRIAEAKNKVDVVKILDEVVKVEEVPKGMFPKSISEFSSQEASQAAKQLSETAEQMSGTGQRTPPTGGQVPAQTPRPIPGDVSSFYNLDRLNISKGAKDAIQDEIDNAGAQLEKTVGKTLSNREVLDLANNSSKVLNNTVTREQTAAKIAADLKLRQQIASVAESGKIDKGFVDLWIKDKSYGEDIARQLQARKIIADPKEVGIIDSILDAIYKVNKNADEIQKAAEGVDFNNAEEVAKFFRSFVKPKITDWLDLLRYNSMLSSPTTHIVNIASNLTGSTIITGIEKTITGIVDATRAALNGKPREYAIGEGAAFVKGYFKNIDEATGRFTSVMSGKRLITQAELRRIPLKEFPDLKVPFTKGKKVIPLSKFKKTAKVTENVLGFPGRLLEAMDQFFVALTEGGINESLAYAKSQGIERAVNATEEAQQRLFRGKLFSPQQGNVLNAIDEVTSLVMRARNSDNPLVSTVAKFSMPFISTATNILKQGIEYTPLGIVTLYGASNKTEQVSKIIMGMTASTGVAMLLGQDRLTWGMPTGDIEKAAFQASGRQPYSVRIGDKWVSYSKLHPALAFNFALIAALEDSRKKERLDDNQIDLILGTVAKFGNFFADQSYVRNIGDILSAARGQKTSVSKFISNYPQQLIPYRAFFGWVERLTDPYIRQVDTTGTILERQVQEIMSQIPGLGEKLQKVLGPLDQPIKNENRVFNAFSPSKVTDVDPGYEGLYQLDQMDRKLNRLKDDINARIDREINKRMR